MEKLGIESLKSVLKLGLALGNGIGKAMEDGKVDLTDIVYLMGALQAAPAAFLAVDKVQAEAKDLDASEMAELVAYAKAEFDLADDELEKKIEKSLEAGLVIYQAVMLWKK